MPALNVPTARKKPSATSAKTVTPRDHSGTLPSWTLPREPRSTADVVALAKEYVEANATTGASKRHLGQWAYMAIMASHPALKRREVEERLRGVRLYIEAWPPTRSTAGQAQQIVVRP